MLSAAFTIRHVGRRVVQARSNVSSMRAMPIHSVRNTSRDMSTIPSWATYDPYSAGNGSDVYSVPNLVDGKWTNDFKQKMNIIDPLDKNKGPIFTICDTQENEIRPFIESLRKVPKSGLHNPLKNPERYLQYGDITRKVRQKRTFLRRTDLNHVLFLTLLTGWSCVNGS